MQTTKTLKGFQVTEYPVEKLGYSISVIKIEGRADHQKSKEILEKLGLEPVPYQNFFMAAQNSPALLYATKGKWGYLAGEGFGTDGISAINEKTGELEAPKVGESVEKLVRTWSGKWPLQVVVLSDYDAAYFGGRFDLDAYGRPDYAASVVFGIKQNTAAPVAKELRVERGEALEVTLPDGQKMQIDATAAKIVKRQ